ncbi:MAG: PorT family protein [Porphyromonadaceae bacterium]|nr:PorT family protein [Porphyromonadaceae bacterium]
MRLLRDKKTLLLIAFLAVAFSSANLKAQTVLLNPPEVYIGTSHGVTGSMMLFRPNVRQSYLLGYNGGVAVRYITENHFGLQVELNYSQRGWNEEGDTYSRRLNYLELPFLTHVYAGNKNRFIFNLGPKIGYLLSESILNDDGSNPEADQRVLPAHFKFDYGITAGLGYNLKTRSAGVFQWELRVYYGLSDVFPNTKSDFFSTSNHLNASINLGYFFQLTGKK